MGKVLQVQNDSLLSALHRKLPLLVNQHVVIGASIDPMLPVVVLNGRVICSCAMLLVDASRSSDRGAVAYWSNVFVSVSVIPFHADVNLTSIEKLIEGKLRHSTSTGVYIPLSSFPLSNVTYVISATLCNSWNLCGSDTLSFNVTYAQPCIVTPIERILSPTHIYVTKADTIFVRGDAFVPVCSPLGFHEDRSRIVFLWHVARVVDNSTSIPLVASTVSTNPAVFRASAFTLTPGQIYKLTLQAYQDRILVNQTDYIFVHVEFSAIKAQLVPSQPETSLRLGESVMLDAATSYDPDQRSNASWALFNYTWSCSSEAIVSQISTRVPCLLALDKISGLGDHALLVTATNVSNALIINSTSIITVEVTDALRPARGGSSATIRIRVVEALTSSALILTTTNTLSRIDHTKELVIQASVLSSVVGSVRWSVEGAAIVGMQSTVSNDLRSTVFSLQDTSVSRTTISLTLRPRFLVPGARYAFVLSTSEGDTYLPVVSTNLQPFGGSLICSPPQGLGLQTDFSLFASGWVDDANDYPLRYTFAFFVSLRSSWYTISSVATESSLEGILLPPGWDNRTRTLPLQVQVQDSLGASALHRTSNLVRVFMPSSVSSTSLLTLVQNASALTSFTLQEAASAVLALLWDETALVSIPTMQRRSISSAIIAAVNTSLQQTDMDNLATANSLIKDAQALYINASASIATTNAQALLSSILSQSQGGAAQILAVAQVLESLAQALKDMQSSGNSNSTTQVLQLLSEYVKLSVALISLPSTSNTTSSNSSGSSFLPTVTLPGSTSSVSVVNGGGSSGGSVVVSVALFNSSILKGANQSSNAAALSGALKSDILTVKVDYSTNKSFAVPAFVANLSVSSSTSNYSHQMLVHNCSVGVQEVISVHCRDANVVMNLTCSGKAEAVVRRDCPVPQQVCNVLNLKDFSVADSGDYCKATQTGAYVICSCGLDSQSQNSSTAVGKAVLANQGAVAVAVMTEYVAGDFSGTVSIAGSVSTSDVAQQSITVFATFGVIWGIGTIIIGVYLFSPSDLGRNGKRKKGSSIRVKKRHQLGMLNHVYSLHKHVEEYVLSIVPSVYRPHSWLFRLWSEVCLRHDYIRMVFSLLSFIQSWEKLTIAEENRKRKREAIELGKLLTSITFSCFVLAMLYDLQFPNNDGSCALHTDETQCLQRSSILDPSQSYCKWQPVSQSSAGVIVESRNGIILQSVTLTATVMDDEADDPCVYANRQPSQLATGIAAVLTSLFSSLVMQLLAVLFQWLDAPTIKEQESIEGDVHIREAVGHNAAQTFASTARSSALEIQSHTSSASPAAKPARRRAVVVPVSDAGPMQQPTVISSSLSSVSPTREPESTRRMSRAHDVAVPRHQRRSSLLKIGKMLVGVVCVWIKQAVFFWNTTDHDIIERMIPDEVLHVRHTILESFQRTYPSNEGAIVIPGAHLTAMKDKTNQHYLMKTSETKYAVSALHACLSDLLRRESAHARILRVTLAKDFPEQVPAVPELSQWLVVFILLAGNLGALALIVLRGVSRGQAWQSNFLFACLLQWVLDVLYVMTVELLWVDFGLPGLFYRDIVEQSVLPLLQTAEEFLVLAAMKARNGNSFSNNSNRNSNRNNNSTPAVDSKSGWEPDEDSMTAASKMPISWILAMDRPLLLESQLVFLLKRRDTVDSDPFSPANRVVSGGLLTWFLRLLSYIPIRLQRLSVRFLAPFLLAGVLLVWIEIKKMQYGFFLSMAFVVGVFSLVVLLIQASIYQQRIGRHHHEQEQLRAKKKLNQVLDTDSTSSTSNVPPSIRHTHTSERALATTPLQAIPIRLMTSPVQHHPPHQSPSRPQRQPHRVFLNDLSTSSSGSGSSFSSYSVSIAASGDNDRSSDRDTARLRNEVGDRGGFPFGRSVSNVELGMHSSIDKSSSKKTASSSSSSGSASSSSASSSSSDSYFSSSYPVRFVSSNHDHNYASSVSYMDTNPDDVGGYSGGEVDDIDGDDGPYRYGDDAVDEVNDMDSTFYVDPHMDVHDIISDDAQYGDHMDHAGGVDDGDYGHNASDTYFEDGVDAHYGAYGYGDNFVGRSSEGEIDRNEVYDENHGEDYDDIIVHRDAGDYDYTVGVYDDAGYENDEGIYHGDSNAGVDTYNGGSDALEVNFAIDAYHSNDDVGYIDNVEIYHGDSNTDDHFNNHEGDDDDVGAHYVIDANDDADAYYGDDFSQEPQWFYGNRNHMV